METETLKNSKLGEALRNNKAVQLAEIAVVFLAAFGILAAARPFLGDHPMLSQSVVWVANVVMLVLVWVGLRLRGEGWSHLGLDKENLNLKAFLLSLLVFVAAVAGFLIGSIVMMNIVGEPRAADMSGYNYLQGNLPLLIIALLAVFIVSSFGEEVIYRGFLITRISEMGGNSRTWIRIAVLASAVVFGLIHFEWGLTGIVQTTFMGLVLAIAYLLLKRNLWVLVLAHAYMDAILLIQLYMAGNPV